MRNRAWSIGGLVAVLTLVPHIAGAQSGGTTAPSILALRDGDCVVKLRDVSDLDIHEIALYVDDVLLTVRPAHRKGRIVELPLAEPVHENSTLRAELPAGEPTTIRARVQQAIQQSDPPPALCTPKRSVDDREVFEASAYMGRSFDNFAPFERDQYIPGREPQEPGAVSRLLAGVESQYRLVGDKGDSFQVWLGGFTLHGIRTADVDCNQTQTSALCSGKTTEKFLATIEHASSLEAHFDARVELLTLQRESETPIKAYALARFGLIDVTGAPKGFNTMLFGAGILSPAGVFKGSYAQVGWGQSQQFQSNPDWNRLKVTGALIFDVMPGFKDRLQFWKRLAGSPRVFVLINVDRNPGGRGPDSVTTHVGVDLDLRRLFFGFGG